MFKLTFDTVGNEEVELQMEFGLPPLFKTIDDASDWALQNLPYGLHIEIRDGRKTLRAYGPNAGGLVIVKKAKK